MDPTMARLKDFFWQESDLRLFAMNGSRVNEKIPADKFQDYDVVFFAENIDKYLHDPAFLARFGEILIMSEPETDGLYPPDFTAGTGYIYLVQYTSGIRIDFQFRTLTQLSAYLKADTLTKVIGDKDHRIHKEIVPHDTQYWLAPPTAKLLYSSANEFAWQTCNTLKAVLRREWLSAETALDLTRNELLRKIAWTVGIDHGFRRSYGKQNTQIMNYLDPSDFQMFMKTYRTDSSEHMLDSLEHMSWLEKKQLTALVHFLALDPIPFQQLERVPFRYLLSKNEPELAKRFR